MNSSYAAAFIGVSLFVVVICPMICFIIRDGKCYGAEVEGGRGGTYDPLTRKARSK